MGTAILWFRPPAWRTTSAVITLVIEAIGRTAFSPFAHSTCPVVASTRMPDFALTPFGAPATSIIGPRRTSFARADAGTIAVVAVDDDDDAGRVAPWA